MRLVDARELNPTEAPRLVDTFSLFAEQLRRTTLSHDQVLAGLSKL
jgi:hypothetical protein